MTAGPALEMWSRQSGSDETPDGQRVFTTFETAYTVTLDATDRNEVAYTAAGLPPLGSKYPGKNYVFCKRYAHQRISPIMAIVTVHFDGEDAPIDAGFSISWGSMTTDEAIDEDWNGKPILTVNGEPIEGITEKLNDDVVTITRNFLSVNRYAARHYRRATNSDDFMGWPPGTARLIDDTADAVIINGVIQYWRVRAVIQFREPFRTTPAKAWYKRVRHEGLYVKEFITPTTWYIHQAWDSNKVPLTRPVLLKPDGTQETNPNNAYWLEFQTLGSLPYNALGLV